MNKIYGRYILLILFLIPPLLLTFEKRFTLLENASPRTTGALTGFTHSKQKVEKEEILNKDVKEKAITYSTKQQIFYFVDIFYTFSTLFLFLYFGFSNKIKEKVSKITKNNFLILGLYLILFSFIYFVLKFPVTFYSSFYLTHKFGLSEQPFYSFLLDNIIIYTIFTLGLVPVVFIGYKILEKNKLWYIWISIIFPFLLTFFFIIKPVFVDPAINKFEPLKDKTLEKEILSLAKMAGIEGSRIYQMNASKQTKTYNAYVTGLLDTKRIVLWDNLLSELSLDEILFVMAHEMGHYVLHHLWYFVIIGSILFFIYAYLINFFSLKLIQRFSKNFKFDKISDIASIPLLFLLLNFFFFLSQPVISGISKNFEHKADVYALEVTKNNESAVSFFKKCANKALVNPSPHPFIKFWLYTHPTIEERINFAEGFKKYDEKK